MAWLTDIDIIISCLDMHYIFYIKCSTGTHWDFGSNVPFVDFSGRSASPAVRRQASQPRTSSRARPLSPDSTRPTQSTVRQLVNKWTQSHSAQFAQVKKRTPARLVMFSWNKVRYNYFLRFCVFVDIHSLSKGPFQSTFRKGYQFRICTYFCSIYLP